MMDKTDLRELLNETYLLETIRKSKEAFYMAESRRILTKRAFLWEQMKLIKKRWWILQILLLSFLWYLLPLSLEVQKSMGVIASLFIILIIPELWKNQTFQCMEIEAAAYYSLRQIYAARMLLFGITDIFLVTLFCGASVLWLQIPAAELMTQFLFPMTVTACICFHILCSNYPFGEAAAVSLCFLWSLLWLWFVLNVPIYKTLIFPLWGLLWGSTLLFLVFSVRRTLYRCNQYWEVTTYETGTA